MAHDVFAARRPALGRVLPPAVPARLRALFERDALAVALVAVWAAVLVSWLPTLIVPDSWLAFVDGRLIAHHGLPHTDSLTAWTLGRPWTDQQWGAQLLLYELMRLGGLRLAGPAVIGCVVLAVAGCAVAARKLGASPRSAAVAVLLPLVGTPWLAEVRTQTLALVPFVVVYALLALDARRSSRRVLLVLPVLVVWANLHGSVVLGAGLAALYGLLLLGRPGSRVRASLLVVGAPLAVLASPYGLGLVGYYRRMLVDPQVAHVSREWRPIAVEKSTILFFVSAFALAALLGRRRKAVSRFEQCATVVLLVAALAAVRNAVWFELAAAVSLPRLLDAAWRPSPATRAVERLNVFLAGGALVAAGAMIALQLARPPAWLEPQPASAAAAVARAAGGDGLVLAGDLHADWLLWQEPALAGRVAYDVRFELFDNAALHRIVDLKNLSRPVWRRCGSGATVVTFADRAEERRIRDARVLNRGARLVVAGERFGAFAQPPAPHRC